MNLVNDTIELQEHVNVSHKFDFDLAKPFIKRVERKYIIPNTSQKEYDRLLSDTITDADVLKVKTLLAEASSNLAFHLGFTQLVVHVTNYGAVQTDLENTKAVDWATRRDLQRTYVQAGFEALDDALKAMELYLDKFPDWRDSGAFTIFDENFNKRTDEFQRHFNISNSRKTFIALKPIIREVEEQYFLPMLGKETMGLIKNRSTIPVLMRALDLAQKAEVALTIAKSVDSGAFIMTGSSAIYRWEQLPWEKSNEYSDERIEKLREAKQNAGEEYLKKLKTLLQENPEVFPNYISNVSNTSGNVLKLKSGLAL
ncbi:DUF6712 family protein [Aquimarina aggregata]|uniref:DUF6712 family protein n=1 Tax=Aquimarina aggregata TaxID=1642818 RepID=UPI0024923483|nr:DUF6712 family protein [Aquimarina aggregata]